MVSSSRGIKWLYLLSQFPMQGWRNRAGTGTDASALQLKIFYSYYFYLYHSSAKRIGTPLCCSALEVMQTESSTLLFADSFLSISAASSATFSQVSVFANICPWTQLDYHYAQIDQALFKIKPLWVKRSACIVPTLHYKKSVNWLKFKIEFVTYGVPLLFVILSSLRF